MSLNYAVKLIAFHVSKAETAKAKPEEQQHAFQRQLVLALLACVMLLAFAQSAYAGTDTPMGVVLCNIVKMVYGNLGRGLACLAVIIIGVGATLGKTSWGLALTVAVGIAVIFNAHQVVDYLDGEEGGALNGCTGQGFN